MDPLVEAAIQYVKKDVAGNDASHDWLHIERVWRLAKHILEKEKDNLNIADPVVVELAAVLHDVQDWKYSKSEEAGPDAVRAFLESQNYDKEKTEIVVRVVKGISYKNEISGGCEVFPELAIVQDADRLDAIGAIGICRAFTYGGAKSRPLYGGQVREGLTKEQYMATGNDASTVNHFHEKLLLLKGRMKTKTGTAMAAARHDFMVQFLEQLDNEIAGTS